ncbi:MAG TPA: OmpA family protein [Verrucomicrobiae bacterium]|nr:OmpA family protein [Bryobacteraceae bacterium]HXU21674.1 OmpA family protein [Verrucomicrobiae bacterium]
MKAIVATPIVLPGVLALLLATGGCATKKHVAQAIAPVQNQVNTVQKQTDENKTAIGDLDRQVASADEKAMDAGRKAGDAATAASKANDAASQAGQRADSAHTLAEQTGAKLDQTVQNMDNYRLANTEKVLFRFGRADLTKDAKASLDSMAQNVSTMKNYLLEVEGYTDRTGGKNYNLALSQRRADAVVRYLTLHNVPLRKIHQIGVGSEALNADNHTREARKQERRVDVRVYALDTTGGNGPLQSSTSPAATTQQ